MGRIWCFGDSNTYGYDPCDFFGGCYSAPWPELLEEKTGIEVINDGWNGRMIPRREYELQLFRNKAERYGADGLIVMLGGNDLLVVTKAREVAARMEAFLTECIVPMILLISPPPMKLGAWVPDDKLVEESRELARQYAALAERLGLQYADAGEWNINLAYDGVHFTEEDHKRFADELAVCLSGMQGVLCSPIIE